uniref:isochorismatase family protein n=1 Tax=Escherichia coli TaxID=562 RepID=UPI0024E101A8
MKNALIVIDIQNDYFPGGSFPLEAPETACKGAVNAIEKAREEGWLIVGIQHIATADAPFFRPDSEGAKIGTVAKLAMRQPFVLFKGLTFQKLCLPGAFRPGDHHN